jgi:hypothetical protein
MMREKFDFGGNQRSLYTRFSRSIERGSHVFSYLPIPNTSQLSVAMKGSFTGKNTGKNAKQREKIQW